MLYCLCNICPTIDYCNVTGGLCFTATPKSAADIIIGCTEHESWKNFLGLSTMEDHATDFCNDYNFCNNLYKETVLRADDGINFGNLLLCALFFVIGIICLLELANCCWQRSPAKWSSFMSRYITKMAHLAPSFPLNLKKQNSSFGHGPVTSTKEDMKSHSPLLATTGNLDGDTGRDAKVPSSDCFKSDENPA